MQGLCLFAPQTSENAVQAKFTQEARRAPVQTDQTMNRMARSLVPIMLKSGRNLRDEESLRVYREDETHPATALPSARKLKRPFDGRGGELHPACEGALTDLYGHAYHLRTPFLLRFHSTPAQPEAPASNMYSVLPK